MARLACFGLLPLIRLVVVGVVSRADRPDGDGAIVTYDAALELKGLLKLAEPIMKLLFKRIGRQADNGLHQALNGEKVG